MKATLDFSQAKDIGALHPDGFYEMKCAEPPTASVSQKSGKQMIIFTLVSVAGSIKLFHPIGAGDNNGFLLKTLEALGFKNLRGKDGINFEFDNCVGKTAVVEVVHEPYNTAQGEERMSAKAGRLFSLDASELNVIEYIPLGKQSKPQPTAPKQPTNKASNHASEDEDVPF